MSFNVKPIKLNKWHIIIVLLLIVLPQVVLPALLIWWFYKKAPIAKKYKIVTTLVVGGLFTLITASTVIAYTMDAEPDLNIIEPNNNISIEAEGILIKGEYTPEDRKVWINNEEIETDNGHFEYYYKLSSGLNEIEIETGDWKRATKNLTVKRIQKESIKTTTTEMPQILFLVTEVVDGDTVKVSSDEGVSTVRLIGIDTPETKDPRTTVQCFGNEATAYLKSLIEGKSIYLHTDDSQDDTDQYGRLLRYIVLEDGTEINKKMVSEGYAYEYTYQVAYQYQNEFKAAQEQAREQEKGLWAENTCSGQRELPTTVPSLIPATSAPLSLIGNQSKPTTKPVTPTKAPTNNSGFTCNCAKTCTQITSCSEAYFQLNECGCKVRDSDDDGIPCETLCQ